MKNNAPVQQKDLSINNGNTFIIDEQMLNIVKRMFVPSNDTDVRIELKGMIQNIDDINELFEALEERVYVHKVYKKMNEM